MLWDIDSPTWSGSFLFGGGGITELHAPKAVRSKTALSSQST